MKPPDIRHDPGRFAATRQQLLADRVVARVRPRLDTHDDDATESAWHRLSSAERAAFDGPAEFRLALTLAPAPEESP